MPDVLPTPKPTKGSGILKFSEDVYLELKYDLSIEDPSTAINCTLHAGELDIPLNPEIIG